MKLSKVFLALTLIAGIIIVIVAYLPAPRALALTDGPLNPGLGTNLTGIGTDPWLTPGNITTPGDPYATIQLSKSHLTSNYLVGSDYGFSIPDDMVILGIEVNITRMFSGHPNVVDSVVSLTTTGGLVGDNKANPTTLPWPTAFGTATYGGPTDLWGVEWTPVEINSQDFGVALAVLRENNGNILTNLSVDTIQVTVYSTYASTMELECGGGTPETAYGDGITCVATVTRAAGDQTPTGTVDWTSDSSGLFESNPCTLAGADGVASCSVTYTPDAVGSGSHLVGAVYSGDEFFATSSNEQSVTVSPRLVTATADPQVKTYADLDPVYTYQVTQGSLVFSDTFTGTLTRDPGENAGQYAILQGTLELPVDYDLSYVGDYLTITPAETVCEVTGYAVTYDGNAYTAEGTCTGVMGEPLEGLDLSGTEHTDAGTYTDPWSFMDVTGNYHDASGTVEDAIGQAYAVCEVAGYDVTYDGQPHTAEGTCTGVMGEPLNGLDLSGTVHTDTGTSIDPWSFVEENGNYNDQNGTVEDNISKAEAVCEITPYIDEYDREEHLATGACLGVDGNPLEGTRFDWHGPY